MTVQCVECDKFLQGRVEEPLCEECASAAEKEFTLELQDQGPKLKCYGRHDSGFMVMEFFESKTKAAVKRRNQLRRHGYGANVQKLGHTTFEAARINLTAVLITTGSGHDDTFGVPISNLELINGCKIEGT